MAMSDPIADMLTRIRNANSQRHASVEIPASRIKTAIAAILTKEGYVRGYDVLSQDGIKKIIRISLKYGQGKDDKVITGIRRISKPGLRIYAPCEKLPKVLGGLGTAIISTNKGLITDKEARKCGVGGEIIAYVW